MLFRSRYPNYDHCAVLIAEDITSRFLNVIQLFNGTIPIIAIQMNAFEINGNVALVFTKVLDELNLGLDDDDDENIAVTDRSYWENKGTKETVRLADAMLEIIKEIDPALELKYNKYYIGLARNGLACNFAIFRAKKAFLKFEIKLEQSDEAKKILDTNDFEVMEYNSRDNRYNIRLEKEDIKNKREFLKQIIEMSYKKWNE